MNHCPCKGIRGIVANLSSQSGASRQKDEIVVVGGSAAGLFTAATLARGGRAVRVLESKSEFRARSAHADRHRSFPQSTRRLGRRKHPQRNSPLRTFHRRPFRADRAVKARPDHRTLEADSRLSREKRNRPARKSLSTRVFSSLSPNSRGLHLEVESAGHREELHAASVVGADGATSRVARTAGWPPIETVPLVQAIVRLPKDCPPDTTRVWFVPDDTPYFYWLIPESPERAALGIIGEGRDTAKRLARFLEKKHMEPLEWQGAQIPVYRKLGSGEAPRRQWRRLSGR